MLKQFLFISIILLGLQLSTAQQPKDNIEISGDYIEKILPALALSSTFIWKNDKRDYLQFVYTLGSTLIVVNGLKRTVNKQRPNGKRYAFPSGHTASSMTSAAFLQIRHGWKAGVPAYLIAGYTGWTRVHANKHDYWDVLAGGAIGVASAYIFAKPFEKSPVKVASFDIRDNGFEISLNYTF